MTRRSAPRKSGLKRLAVAGAAAVALAMFAPTATEATRLSTHVSSVEPQSLEAAATGHEGWRRRPRRGFFFLEGSTQQEQLASADDAQGKQSSGRRTLNAKQDGEEEGDPWDLPDKPVVPGPFYPWHDKDGKDEQKAEAQYGPAFLAHKGKEKQNFFFSATPDEPSKEEKPEPPPKEEEKSEPVTYLEDEMKAGTQESQGNDEGRTEDKEEAGLNEGEADNMQPEPAAGGEASSARNGGREFFRKMSRGS